MSRLLMLLPSVPVPLDSGARIRNHGLLKLLGCEHEVDAIAFGEPTEESELGRLARRATVVPRPTARTIARRAVDLARSDLPDMAARLWSPTFRDTVRCALRHRAYDAVQAEGIEMARYLDAVPPRRRIYDAHNAEFMLQRLLAENNSGGAAALYSRLQWRRLERFEGDLVRTSRLTLAVSHHDANQLISLAGWPANVQVVPNAVDAAAYPFRLPPPEVEPNVLFLGKLDFRPNSQGVGRLIEEVLPHLDDVTLFAVGAAPPRWLIKAGQHNPRIAVTGYVDDDRPYMARCAAMVLPLQTGGGSRLKALIAMASGLPLVSTRFGMQGLDAEPETHYVLAESTPEWLLALKRLFGEAGLRQRLARNARDLVERRYDWSAIRAEVRAAYAWLDTA